MDRRMFIKAGTFAAVGTAIRTTGASASYEGLISGMKREAKTAPVKLHAIKPGFSVLENTGGNITVFRAEAGTLLVDSGIAEQNPQILRALEGAQQTPIREVINTHWHFDHTSGNPWFGEAGARITAHQNTLNHLLVRSAVTPWRYTFEPIPASGRPTNLLTGNSSIEFGEDRASIHFVENAHTDGDLLVRFDLADIVSTGDIFWNGHYPFIDYEAGGSIDGLINAAALAVSLSTPETVIVPGHGPTTQRADLQEYLAMLRSVRSAVASLKSKRYTEAAAIAAKPTAQFDKKYGDYAVGPDDFVSLVFRGI